MTTWRFEHQKYKITDTQLLNPRSGFPCSLFLLIRESHRTPPAASAQTRSLVSVSLCRSALTTTPSAPCVPLLTGLLALVLVSPPHTGARVMAEKHALCSLLKILWSCMSPGPVRCLPPPQALYSHLRAILIVTDAVSVGLPQSLCASASCPHPPAPGQPLLHCPIYTQMPPLQRALPVSKAAAPLHRCHSLPLLSKLTRSRLCHFIICLFLCTVFSKAVTLCCPLWSWEKTGLSLHWLWPEWPHTW